MIYILNINILTPNQNYLISFIFFPFVRGGDDGSIIKVIKSGEFNFESRKLL